jgi:TRAP-type transport system small permease protein
MRYANRLLDHLAALLFAGTLLLVAVQIVCRFVLSLSVPWTEEVSRLVFVWLAFIGASLGVREGSMIVIDTLPLAIGPPWQRVMGPLVHLVSIAIIAFLFHGSLILVESVWPTTLSTVDWISNGWIYLAFTTSFGLMLLYSVRPLLQSIGLLGARR